MEAIILIGIQATGKSSFYFNRFSKTHVRINLDMLRTRNREAKFLGTCIETKQRFVIDNTNPTKSDRQRYFDALNGSGFKIHGYFFQSRINDALKRNSLRSGKECIPDAGIRRTHSILELPSLDEGFDFLSYVKLGESIGDFVVEEWKSEV